MNSWIFALVSVLQIIHASYFIAQLSHIWPLEAPFLGSCILLTSFFEHLLTFWQHMVFMDYIFKLTPSILYVMGGQVKRKKCS